MPGMSGARLPASNQLVFWHSVVVQGLQWWTHKSSPDVKDLINVKLYPHFNAVSCPGFVPRRTVIGIICNNITLDNFMIEWSWKIILFFFPRKTPLWYFFNCLTISVCFSYNNHYQLSRQMLSSWCICFISDGEMKRMISVGININEKKFGQKHLYDYKQLNHFWWKIIQYMGL